jgi:glutathione S-transferase
MTKLYTDKTPPAIKNSTVCYRQSSPRISSLSTIVNSSQQGLHLITESTPNGKKVQIFLEELKDVYGTSWQTSLIDLETDEQKEDWFLRLNPNGKSSLPSPLYILNLLGRIPILIDNTQTPPFPIMESSAELLYLAENFDKDHIFGFDNAREHSEVIQWLFFWQASGQPNQSQNNHFKKSAPEKIPCKSS